jgi:hypothetical protein
MPPCGEVAGTVAAIPSETDRARRSRCRMTANGRRPSERAAQLRGGKPGHSSWGQKHADTLADLMRPAAGAHGKDQLPRYGKYSAAACSVPAWTVVQITSRTRQRHGLSLIEPVGDNPPLHSHMRVWAAHAGGSLVWPLAGGESARPLGHGLEQVLVQS